ncbi:hypothetical protein [Fluviicola sp.]|jgi:hypothetical protein|uniref:hypothetical protein n=1 Tax=Fluviicola sp. TaxID=1917219 RepID=UPI00282DD931|nr:hypothetical protein [Fluviicola sp.]MDR0801216.1 hypothetical protein [Fluviicola sp.]
MYKNRITLLLVLITSVVKAQTGQVGINTSSPKSTLDVQAQTTAPGKAEGIIAPRLTGAVIQSKDADYGSAQTGAIVYATSASPDAGLAGAKTINIDNIGYYYFDGTVWQSFTPQPAWNLTGNAGTNPAINYLGTKDDNNLYFRRGGGNGGTVQAGLIDGGNPSPKATVGPSNDSNSNGTGMANTAFGAGALPIVYLAYDSGYMAQQNTAIGAYALSNNASPGAYATNIDNVAVGYQVLASATSANQNVAVGNFALVTNIDGGGNVAMGYDALSTNTHGTYNTAIGDVAGNNITTGSFNIAIGNSTSLPSATANNQMNIGNSIYGINMGSGTVKIGVNTNNPQSTLEVNGSAVNTAAYQAGATGATAPNNDPLYIDFTKSNLAYTSASAGNGSGGGTTFTINGIKDGGAYTLAVKGGTSGTAAFTISGGITPHLVNNGPTTAHTLYTIIVIGGDAYIWMATGF